MACGEAYEGQATGAARQRSAPPALRACHVGPDELAADRSACLDRVRRLGFDTLLLAPPFRPGRSGDILHPGSLQRLHPDFGGGADAADFLARLAEEATARGLRLLLDLTPELAADADVALERPDWFRAEAPGPAETVDPRRRWRRHVAAPCFEAPGLVDFFADRMTDWLDAGICGFRCLAVPAVPIGVWRALIERARARRQDALFCAWTPGLGSEDVEALAATGFDLSFASTPWWDFRAPWLVAEYEARRLSIPPLGLAAVPGATQLPDSRAAALRRLAAAAYLGHGYLMPLGFAGGADAAWDLEAEVAAINRGLADEPLFAAAGPMCQPTGERAEATAIVRRGAGRAALLCFNPADDRAATLDAGAVLPALAGDHALPLRPDEATMLPPAAAALHLAEARSRSGGARPVPAARAVQAPRIAIERVAPGLAEPQLAVKRLAGEMLAVEADIFLDGHESLRAELLWRRQGQRDWQRVEMRHAGNDRWQAAFPLTEPGRYLYTIEAWRDLFGGWHEEVGKKRAAGLQVAAELLEGRVLIERAAEAAGGPELTALVERLEREEAAEVLLSTAAVEAMHRLAPRVQAVRLPIEYAVVADRQAAAFGAWYELFPRSQSGSEDRHGTFDDVIERLPAIRRMGFDVLYMPPIHPIGRTNRKGRNNALKAAEGEPGSPYAIGAAEGGHDAVHPDLGGLPAFRRLVRAAAGHGMEIALDFAIQCAPDHPWLRQHPEWFAWRPDGSLRYAENPPKKYEDIVNVDFYAEGAVPGLWNALRDVVLFWIGEGVRIFRVDNPHTKPLPFWQWLIAEVQRQHPGAIFLAEAFTRPAMMRRLGKIGFTQSYTYFTWRNHKAELIEYMTELTATEMREYYRPHFFVNTPDINPVFLQRGGRPAFLIRAALAATLSGLWGLYSGFELCEATPLPGREEYHDSEKYQIRAWDWDRPGNIVAEIARLNRIRRENPALWSHLDVAFLDCPDPHLLCYRKATPARDNLLVIAVNLDPFGAHAGPLEVPLWELGLPDDASVEAEDLVGGGSSLWTGKRQWLHLDPQALPYAIWRLSPAGRG